MDFAHNTRHSRRLPALLGTLHLLCASRVVLGVSAEGQPTLRPDVVLGQLELDEQIEALNDEIRATELLHEAAVLVGDCQ